MMYVSVRNTFCSWRSVLAAEELDCSLEAVVSCGWFLKVVAVVWFEDWVCSVVVELVASEASTFSKSFWSTLWSATGSRDFPRFVSPGQRNRGLCKVEGSSTTDIAKFVSKDLRSEFETSQRNVSSSTTWDLSAGRVDTALSVTEVSRAPRRVRARGPTLLRRRTKRNTWKKLKNICDDTVRAVVSRPNSWYQLPV